MQTGYTAEMRNKEVAFAASCVHMLGREAAGTEPVPTAKPHPLREKGVCLGLYREQERNCSPVQEEREGREGRCGQAPQTCGFSSRIPESSPMEELTTSVLPWSHWAINVKVKSDATEHLVPTLHGEAKMILAKGAIRLCKKES